ncbi:ankyrin repeat domain-containing protein 52 [Colletotrichum musicola]|uniref:Ankyrin repeat domain-containing protein 52 n=1 Tax=Colletotrichum musicola TaxID=2175873 RepID=A0A8H6NXW2_9PEZI|nr:ankyrin repeat domain-containing protein 52 [Colletotrichum musicola]
MEPVGLSVGIAGLAGLFSTCLDAVQRFDSYKNYGRDSRSLAAQFDADKHRLEQWGQAVGINTAKLSDTHHPLLDNQKTLSLVHRLLVSIQDFCSSADDAIEQQPLLVDGEFPTNKLLFARPRQEAPTDSKWRKLAWALRGKTKRTDQVQTFALLVQCLYNVVPPDDAKGIRLGYDGCGYGPAHLQTPDNAPKLHGVSNGQISENLSPEEGPSSAETKRDLRAWLRCPSSPNDLYDDAIQKRLDGTCEWILTQDVIRDWLSRNVSPSASQMMWINGPAGFGKTVLCAKLVEVLSSTLQTPVAYFFLSSRFEGSDDPFMAIRSWIADVMSQSQAALEVVHRRRLAQHEQAATRATIFKLFREVLQAVPCCTFVLDGLDECTWGEETRNGGVSVVRFLDELRQAVADTTTRILVVSRNELEIRQGLTQYPGFSEYTISPEDVRADNMAYSISIVNNKLRNKDEPTKRSISQRMADRCNGQFQWLKMQETSLRKGRNKKQLERDIDETPAGLDHLYDRNWEKIERLQKDERKRAFGLLRWAAFSVRPLTICEITEAVLVDDDCDDLPIEDMPDAIDDDYIESEILGVCGSLIEVRSAALETSPGSRVIHLSHFSVKQYLLGKITSQEAGPLVKQWWGCPSNEGIENCKLAKLCLRYISFPQVWGGFFAEEKGRIGPSFRDYAAGSWFQHAATNEAKNTDTALVASMNALFDRSSQTWDAWSRWYDNNCEGSQPNATEASTPACPLYYAARLKVTSKSSRILLEKGADITVANTNGETPLNAASWNGHFEVVKILLENGANVSVADTDGWTPLNAASSNGHLDVVKILLEKGADITVADTDGWTPLYAASSNGHLDVVKILLEKGADVLVATNDGWTPLNSASNNGHLETVKVLTGRVNLDHKSPRHGRTALSYAAESGHEPVVQLLLADNHVSPCSVDHLSRTPLFFASKEGHAVVVNVLSNWDSAFLDWKDHYGSTPLSAAARKGHVDVVKSLLATEAVNLDSRDQFGRTPLWWARRHGNAEVSQLLLESGKKRDISLDVDWMVPEVNTRSHNSSFRCCDVCLFSISEDCSYFLCSVCNGGDFDICLDCFNCGGRCPEESHVLVLRGKQEITKE